MDSHAQAATKLYIIKSLNTMGLQPEIQVTTNIQVLSDDSDKMPQIPGMKLPPRPVDTMPAI